MKKNFFKKMMATALVVATVLSTNSITAKADSFNLHWTKGAPESANCTKSYTSLTQVDPPKSYVTVTTYGFNVQTVGAYITHSCSQYPIESGYINGNKVTKLSFIGSIPQKGMPFNVETKLNNYEISIVVTAYGYVGL